MNVRLLEEAKSHWQFAADSLPQLICLVDEHGRVIRANRTVERWGLSSVALVKGLSLHDVLHGDCKDPDCYLKDFWQSAAADLMHARRTQCDAWDPVLNRHFAIATLASMQNEEQVAGSDRFFALVSIDDQSALKAAEAKRQSEAEAMGARLASEIKQRHLSERVQARLLSVIELTPSLIATTDKDGGILYLNEAGRRLLGLGIDEDLSGLTMNSCQKPQACKAFLTDHQVSGAACDGVWNGETILETHDGRKIPVAQVVIAHRDGDGILEGFSICARDMTEWLRTGEAMRRSEVEVHLSIQEGERQRIAADLHDGLGQTLGLLKLSIEGAAKKLADGSVDAALLALQRLVPMAKDAMSEMRRIAMDLRPSTLDDLGILPTLSWFFREFEESCPAIEVERVFEIHEKDVPKPLKLAIYRILQEAVSNCTKHARADRIRVELAKKADHIQLIIEDNGQGFDVDLLNRSSTLNTGLGLNSMRERAELSGGIFGIESAPEQGTRISIHWPSKMIPVNDVSRPSSTCHGLKCESSRTVAICGADRGACNEHC